MSGPDPKLRPIIIKRKKIVKAHHGGGTWKIAYADFMTAMMAFFLLMWLLGSITKGDLKGISEYFQMPLKVALEGGDHSADGSSIIKGGGTDITRVDGQARQGRENSAALDQSAQAQNAANNAMATLPGQGDALLLKDQQRLEQLKSQLETLMNSNKQLSVLKKQLQMDMTAEGLRIQIIDDQNRPLFDLSSAVLKDYAKDLLNVIGVSVSSVPNAITISGHTDAFSYQQGPAGYSNWELSTERANAARREMIQAGLPDTQVLRIVGHGSSAPLDATHPTNPINRRISIVVLNRQTEALLRAQNQPSAVKKP